MKLTKVCTSAGNDVIAVTGYNGKLRKHSANRKTALLIKLLSFKGHQQVCLFPESKQTKMLY